MKARGKQLKAVLFGLVVLSLNLLHSYYNRFKIFVKGSYKQAVKYLIK